MSPGNARQGKRLRWRSYQSSRRATNAVRFCGVSSRALWCFEDFETGMSANSDNGETNKRSGRRGPKQLVHDATGLLKHHLSARGFAQVEIVTRWAEIAGAKLAEHCFPFRLSQGGATGATLTLVADDRAALELQHQAPKLIDKINTYFGKA
ncbi:MAG: DciA family protein, partial [Parvularculaceae bacterium]